MSISPARVHSIGMHLRSAALGAILATAFIVMIVFIAGRLAAGAEPEQQSFTPITVTTKPTSDPSDDAPDPTDDEDEPKADKPTPASPTPERVQQPPRTVDAETPPSPPTPESPDSPDSPDSLDT